MMPGVGRAVERRRRKRTVIPAPFPVRDQSLRLGAMAACTVGLKNRLASCQLRIRVPAPFDGRLRSFAAGENGECNYGRDDHGRLFKLFFHCLECPERIGDVGRMKGIISVSRNSHA